MNTPTPLTRQQRERLARRITDAVRAHTERHNEVHGDYADGERYLRDEASDEELHTLVIKWSKIDSNKE